MNDWHPIDIFGGGLMAEVRLINGVSHLGTLKAEIRDSRGHPILMSLETSQGIVGFPWASVVEFRQKRDEANQAGVVGTVDTQGRGPCGRRVVRVRLPPLVHRG